MSRHAQNDASVEFLYGTAPGRILLKALQKSHVDRIAVRFLHSHASKAIVPGFVKKHSIPVTAEQLRSFSSYRDFFLREVPHEPFDMAPDHLISPCDGWLSAFPISEDSCFSLKSSHYALRDLLQAPALAAEFHGGDCLIFRLCASDYHHYCYIDEGFQHENHEIPGVLHSVQPIACENFPVFVQNRRCWTLLETKNFGPVVQAEIGALIVGGIVNPNENKACSKGKEKGYFDLAGSTIVLFFQKGQIRLRQELLDALREAPEVRVEIGAWIGTAGNGQ